MASYEEYAKKYLPSQEGSLDDEIAQAGEAQVARQVQAAENAPSSFEIPERFAGKSAEEIAKSYMELEKLNSRQAQDLGSMRALVDSLAVNGAPNPTPAAVEPEPTHITVDDLYDNPDEAISKAVSSHPALKRLEQIEQTLNEQRVEAAKQSFAAKHPDYETVGQDPAFLNWVASDSTRTDLFNRANDFDFGAADALLSLYKAEHQITSMTGEVQRQTALHDGMLETSGATEPPAPATFSRQEWLRALTRAKQGDLQAEDWVNQNQAAYRRALASGNVRD